MRPELKRIEAALEEASNQYLPSAMPAEPPDPWQTPGVDAESMSSDPLPEFAASPECHRVIALTNSALAISLLSDLQTQVQTWITHLQELLHQIQAVYDEGPIVAGWLESFNPNDPTQSSYRLCGLDADGQMWQRHCPHDQLPDVSLAIVRYQRLQALLTRKQKFEMMLGQLTESLVEVHEKLADATE